MNRFSSVSMIPLILVGGTAWSAEVDQVAEAARKEHAAALVVDTHVDTPNLLRRDWQFADEHAKDHVDLPRMRKGGVDAVFFAVWIPGTVTGPKAVGDAIQQIAALHDLAAGLPDDVALCTTPQEIRRAHEAGKVAIVLELEGGQMINNSLSILRLYGQLGIRCFTLTHMVNTDWADSANDEPVHGGLTKFGEEVVEELNRLGILVDVSHVSDDAFWDALRVSRAPLIASHSCCRALAPNPRNMTDEMIKALAAKGGVIQIAFGNFFIDTKHMKYRRESRRLWNELMKAAGGSADEEKIHDLIVEELGPEPPMATWEAIVDQIDHAVKLVGVDHVGIGSDFDGAGMPQGMDDVTHVPQITEALLRRNYSPADVRKILGENTLRLMEDVQRVAAELNRSNRQSGTP